MQKINKLLVVIEPELMESLALKRAKQISEKTKAALHLLICDKEDKHAALLSVLENALRAEGVTASSERSWHESKHQTIIQAQQAENCGLVIKQHIPDPALKKLLLTPEDWKLLRYCPAPVLLAKCAADWDNGVVLTAVDVGNDDADHMELHKSIVDAGFEIASLIKGKLHVVSAYPAPMLAAVEAAYPIETQYEAIYRKACEGFQKQYDIDGSRLHVEEGPADVIIPRVADELHAAVTVMGTVARTGFSGALIGNTAEVVIDKLKSDILVLKPEEMTRHLEKLASKH